MATTNRSPIFIVGPPRSGSTLLQYCLNAHHRIYILPETHFFPVIYGKRYLPGSVLLGERKSGLVEQLFRKSVDPAVARFTSREATLHKKIAHMHTYRQIFTMVMRYLSDLQGSEITGEKSPIHFLFIPLILKWYPDATICFMQRDPKLVAASYIHNRPFHTYKTRSRALRRIISLIVMARSMMQRYTYRCLPISYHRLTHDPKSVLTAFCNHQNLTFEEDMLHPGVNNSSYTDNPGFYTGSNHGIIPQDQDKWRKVLSYNEALKIERCVGQSAMFEIGKMEVLPTLVRLKAKKHLSLWGVNPF